MLKVAGKNMWKMMRSMGIDVIGELQYHGERCRMRCESHLPEVPFQGCKVQSSQNRQVHNQAHEEPHGGESSDGVHEVYFEMPPKRLVDHLTQ